MAGTSLSVQQDENPGGSKDTKGINLSSDLMLQKQLLEKSLEKEKVRAMRAEEAFAIEKRKVGALSAQISSLKEHYASTEIECENAKDQLQTCVTEFLVFSVSESCDGFAVEEKLRQVRKEAADSKAEVEGRDMVTSVDC
eukprot:764568-Hanusia_phi.AAC.2